MDNITAENFRQFLYSRNIHFKYFQDNNIDLKLYGKRIEPEESDVRIYQNMLVYSFVKNNLHPGTILLEIGNETSPVSNVLQKENYTCFKLGFELPAQEIKNLEEGSIKWTIKDQNGNILNDSFKNYFDFSYSISAFDNIPENENLFSELYSKMNEYIKPLSYSIHCFIGSVNADNLIWKNKFLNFLSNQINSNLNSVINSVLLKDKELFYLSEYFFNKYWKMHQNFEYKYLGKMFSINLLIQNFSPLKISNFQEFTYSKKSHFELFDQIGYSEIMYGEKIQESERSIDKYQDLLLYSLIKNNFTKGSNILIIGRRSTELFNVLANEYNFFTLKEAEILLKRTLKSSDENLPVITDANDNIIDFFPFKFFDFIYSTDEFKFLEDNLYIYTNIVTNVKLMKKDFGYVLFSFKNIFLKGLAQDSKFIYFLFNYVRKINKFSRYTFLLADKDLFSEENKEFSLSKDEKISAKNVCYNILWKTFPELPAISMVRPAHSLKKRPAYIFHHIMKSGGTSVVLTLGKWFKVIYDHTEDPNGIYKGLNDYINYKINLENIYSDSCIVAHFQYDGYLLPQRYPEAFIKNNEFKLFTFVRDPLQLMISLYYYGKTEITTTLEKYLNGHSNYLSKFFPCNDTNYKEVLDKYFFIGIVEKMQESFDKLAELTGKEKVTLPFVNKSEKDEQVSMLTDSFKQKFKENNKLDYKIYNYCLDKFKNNNF